ncbi:VWA domain-containing protein, partial [Candidatus Pacearchaeota archaeon]
TYNLPIDNFHSGTNTIELRGTNIHVAGGFIKINYIGGVEFANFTRYSFPGVKGAINVYDGMYIPGQLNSMDILLHLDSDEDVFLNIGNVTVYNGTTNGEENITISNSLLSSLLDYNSLSSETVPIRIGLINASFQSLTQNADVFSVTDLSGSMEDFCDGGWDVVWCCFFGPGYQECKDNATACQSCGGTHIPKLSNAQEANRVLVNSVLNYSGNRVGLVGFRWTTLPDDYHPLSDDNNSLIAEIDSWWAGGGTCICCGINRAVQGFQENWSDSTVKAMVVMSDGIAGTECSEQGTGDARQDAIQAACEAKNNYNITVYAVGFGEGADEATLQSIASCGGGSYYYSTIDQIAQIYSQISQEIIASYQEQTIQVQGAINTTLYPDSYIAINYTSPASNVYGLKAVVEEQFDDAYHASFDIPADVTISEARVTSYSGPRWTSRVFANNTLVYDLSKYGDEFISLGDPYFVYIPPSLLQTGQTNTINLTTGTTPDNSTQGSAYNKVIYTAFKNATSFTPVLARADGCNWTIDFYDDTQINISVPSNYNGNEQCSYTSGTTGTIASSQDALQVAVLELLRELDFNSDGKVDVKFTSQDLQLSTNEIVDIPYVWSTEVEVRTWV